MEVESQCPICLDSLEIDGSTVINCGHMYHFNCLQQMYETDYKNGKRSICAVCRVQVKNPPVRLYGTTGLSKEAISYKIESEAALQPNIEGKKRFNAAQTPAPPTPTANNSETIEFYENRLADLEAMLEEYEGIDDQVEELENDLEETQELLERARVELDRRNLEMAEMSGRRLAAEKRAKQLEEEVEAAKKELEGYKYMRASTEVDRLANEISRLQSDSFYKNLSKDPEIDKDQVILMLAGMTAEYQKMKIEREGVEKEIRLYRVYKEKFEKLEKLQRLEMLIKVQEPRVQLTTIVDDDETDLETDLETKVNNNNYVPPQVKTPHFMSSSTSKMVPKSLPLALKQRNSGASASTGTGKKSKVIDMPGGKKFFIS